MQMRPFSKHFVLLQFCQMTNYLLSFLYKIYLVYTKWGNFSILVPFITLFFFFYSLTQANGNYTVGW